MLTVNTPNSSSKLTLELEETDKLIINRKQISQFSYNSVSKSTSYSSLSSFIASDHELFIILLGAAAGNFLEWFNFSIFGLMADIFGQLFFPASNTTIHLIQVYVLYAAVFLMRPIGGILFGMIGDRYGRLLSLKLSIILMASSTFITCILPTYETIGISATVLMILIRLIQGISVGGELTGVMIYVVEICPQQHRAIFAILVQITGMGTVLASGIMAILNIVCTQQQILNWAWRLPFAFGCLIGIFGIWARFYLKHETPVFKQAERHGNLVSNPIQYAFETCKWRMFSMTMHTAFSTFGYYVYFVWLPTYFSVINSYNFNVFGVNTIGMVICSLTSFISAYWIDNFKIVTSTKITVIFGSINIILAAILFRYLNDPSDNIFAIVIWLILAMSFGLYWGSAAGIWLIDILPDIKCRNTAFGVGYNTATALFGGTATLIATFVDEELYGITSIGWTVFIIGFISVSNDIIAAYFTRNTTNMFIVK
eukprot:188912_1